MRVFISWSGEPSRRVAELMRSWIPLVIQEVVPFVSSQDIAKGTRGMDTIGQQLAETDFGIIVLTPQNANAPWINFEAGALSKNLATGHVIPILCEIEEVDLAGSPLRQFQWARFEQDQILSVISSINASCTHPLDANRLQRSFEVWWPACQQEYESIKPSLPDGSKDEGLTADQTINNALVSILNDLAALRRDSGQQARVIKQLADNIPGPIPFERPGSLGGLGGLYADGNPQPLRYALGDLLGMKHPPTTQDIIDAARVHARGPAGDSADNMP